MTDHLGLRRTRAVVLGGSLMCAVGSGFAFDMGNTVNPSPWMGGNSWAGQGYGYGGTDAYGGPASVVPGPYDAAPYGYGPGGASAGYAPPASNVRAPAARVPVPPANQLLRIRDLERRIGILEAEERRRVPMPPSLGPSIPGTDHVPHSTGPAAG